MENKYMKVNSINDIQPLKYEGYLWMSDEQYPKVFIHDEVEFPETDNPFIVEGQLFNKENGISYSIKYVDGEYIIHEYKVTEADLQNPDNETKEYLSNRMEDKWLKFLRYWEAVPDENSMGMPVLKLTKSVFIGFKEKED